MHSVLCTVTCLGKFTIFSLRATISRIFNDCIGSRVKPENPDIHAIARNSRESAEMGLYGLISVSRMNSKCSSILTLVRYS